MEETTDLVEAVNALDEAVEWLIILDDQNLIETERCRLQNRSVLGLLDVTRRQVAGRMQQRRETAQEASKW